MNSNEESDTRDVIARADDALPINEECQLLRNRSPVLQLKVTFDKGMLHRRDKANSTALSLWIN